LPTPALFPLPRTATGVGGPTTPFTAGSPCTAATAIVPANRAASGQALAKFAAFPARRHRGNGERPGRPPQARRAFTLDVTPFEVSLGGLMVASLSVLTISAIRIRSVFSALEEEPSPSEPPELRPESLNWSDE